MYSLCTERLRRRHSYKSLPTPMLITLFQSRVGNTICPSIEHCFFIVICSVSILRASYASNAKFVSDAFQSVRWFFIFRICSYY
ncbi:hypothetical protein EYC80_002412 [Monilinia laxa]|uniref:Uncharacterized protein n=1 Tax=Monilinia laxa TaxID=61186 RepID=A0A5N6K3W9_MONLA|nr:hypothetical protein EYC80_002412 [Monilinia laxa]